jgi:hypothetical protein
MPMTILLISLLWLGCLAALVLRLAMRPERAPAKWERSPSLLKNSRADFEQAIEAILSSKTATAKDVRDRAQHDLYVRP